MAGEDPDRIAWIRQQECAVTKSCSPHTMCMGEVGPHHPTQFRAGGDGALRAHDDTAIPMCGQHHVAELHGLTGTFKGWSGEHLRLWEATEVDVWRARYTVFQSRQQTEEPFEW